MTELQLYTFEERSQISTAFSSLNPLQDGLMPLRLMPFFTLAILATAPEKKSY
jgi:hypothetical protein